MNEHQQLRESMWDLVYGLGTPEEEYALIDRIKSDPAVARLYAEVRLEADLVSRAAKVEDASLVLPTAATAQVAESQPADGVQLASSPKTVSRSRMAPTLLAAMATAVLMLIAVGLWWPLRSQSQLARNLIAIDVLSDPARPAGLTRKLELRTYAVRADGESHAAVANVELRLLTADGEEVLKQAVLTDRGGAATVEIPGPVVERGTIVEVSLTGARTAVQQTHSDKQAKIVAELPVQPEPTVAYFFASEPMVEAGKPVEVSLWNFSAFSAKPAPAEAAVEEVEGITLQKAESNSTRPGVIGDLVEPQSPSADKEKSRESGETLLRRELDRAASEQRVAGVQLQQNAQTLQRGGQRRAMAQNRFSRGDQQQAGGGFGAGFGGGAETAASGDVPTVPPGEPIKLSLPATLSGREFVVTASCRGAIVATAVHSAPAAPGKREQAQVGDSEMVLDLPPEADGLIEVSLYDRSSQEPVLVEQRQYYREPLKQLQIAVARGKDRYAPGEKVALELRVTDEAGRPAANARLGVRVWNELSLQEAPEPPVMLSDAVRNNYVAIEHNTDPQSQSRQSDFANQRAGAASGYLQAQSNGRASLADAGAAADRKLTAGKELELVDQASLGPPERARSKRDLVAGTEGRAATPPANVPRASEPLALLVETALIELASSREAVRQTARAASEDAERQRRQARATIGTITVIAGLALLVVVGLGALRRVARAPLLVPAAVVALAGTLLGVMWSEPLVVARKGAVAMATKMTTAAAPERSFSDAMGDQRLESASAAPAEMSGVPAGIDSSFASDAGGIAPAAAGPVPTISAAEATAPSSTLAVADEKRAPGQANAAQAESISGGGTAGGGRGPAVAAISPATPLPRIRTGAPPQIPAEPPASIQPAVLAKDALAKDAPTALYFNPQLMTDADGRASVELVMPNVASEYRVLIDALGQGRVGSGQDQLIIDASDPQKAAAGAK